MKALLVILLGLALGIVVAQIALEDPGYVLITLKPWSIELSLITFLALLAFTLFVLYAVVRGLVRLGGAPKALSEWRQRQLLNKARKSHDQGMLHLMNGEWAKSEKRLISYVDHALHPTLNWLAAARAADGRGDNKQRDRYLSQVSAQDEREKLALILTRAELQANSGELEPALESLYALRHLAPKNTKVLALMAQVQTQLKQWRGLMDTAKEARRLGALSTAECERLEIESADELLRAVPAEELSGLWHSLPRTVHEDRPSAPEAAPRRR